MRPEDLRAAEEERTHHQYAIQAIAERFGLPAAGVAALYEHELADLQQGARIKSYLSIFASRRVDELLRRGRLPAPDGGATATP